MTNKDIASGSDAKVVLKISRRLDRAIPSGFDTPNREYLSICMKEAECKGMIDLIGTGANVLD